MAWNASKFARCDTPSDLDVISDLKFAPDQAHLLASSWDGRLLLYDCSVKERPGLLAEYKCEIAALRLAFGMGRTTFVGCLDGTVRELDYENRTMNSVTNESLTPEHLVDKGINNLCSVPEQRNLIASSTFGGTLSMLDTRSRQPVYSKQHASKIFNMDATSRYLTISSKHNAIDIFDLRNLASPLETRNIGLKFQIKALKCMPDGEAFALSTLDGRVSIEYYNASEESQAKRFTFKCHRHYDKTTNSDWVFPVNALAVNSQNGNLFTASSDGHICKWNCSKRKRLRQYPKFTTDDGIIESVVKIDLNSNNTLMAAATCDDGFKNMNGLSRKPYTARFPTSIYLRQFDHND